MSGSAAKWVFCAANCAAQSVGFGCGDSRSWLWPFVADGSLFVLRRRNGSLLEEMMHPMGSGVENKKDKRSGNRDTDVATVFTR